MVSQPPRTALLLAAVAVIAAAGCYSPALVDCTILCGAGGACPSGTACGADNYCHVDSADSCFLRPDAPASPIDARAGAVDARTGAVDAPPAPPDAPGCPGATTGEPDDTCPGERVPIVEGQSLVFADRALIPARDLDIFAIPVTLRPVPTCPASQRVNYALRVTLTTPPGIDARLRRFTSDRTCGGQSDRVGTAYCLPFSVFCAGPPTVDPVFFFAVDAPSPQQSCTPYTVQVQVCAAGSTCDNCR
jgi:hypothetical protein